MSGISPWAGGEIERCRDEGGDGALHVDRTAPVEIAAVDFGLERIDRPALDIAHGHHVAVARKTEMRRARAQARVEIVDVGRTGLAEGQPMAREPRRRERALERAERAVVGRRHRLAADEVGRERDRIEPAHGRKSSLIEVLERVFSSTRLMMTAQ
jgi:hypothetical protein